MGEAGKLDVTVGPLDSGRSVVRVCGEVDMATSAELEAILAGRPSSERVVLDLTECGFLDSSGIRVVLMSAERALAAGGGVSVVAPDARIRRVLEIAGVDARVSIHPTVEAAALESAG